MSRQYRENNSGQVVNSSGCSYGNLSRYNQHSALGVGVPSDTVSGAYIVPTWGSSPGYDALTHGSRPGCTGYFGIGSAYGKDAGACKQTYALKSCR